MYKKTLIQRKLPRDWKFARITPLFKKESKRKPENYISVSLTSQTCKVMERMLKEHFVDHLEFNNLVSQHQHGSEKEI